jgi:hypothetical protein
MLAIGWPVLNYSGIDDFSLGKPASHHFANRAQAA